MKGRINVVVRVSESGAPREFERREQTARTLLVLLESRQLGVTALECSRSAYRLAAYCRELRRDHALAIRCEREEHSGSCRNRYVLESAFDILNDGPELPA